MILAQEEQESTGGSSREDQVTIMQLKSHIVAMEYEIECLQERVHEMEVNKTVSHKQSPKTIPRTVPQTPP